MKQRIIAVHLSGSSQNPTSFRHALETLNIGYDVVLYTALPSGSCDLDKIEEVEERHIFYRQHGNRLVSLLYLLMSQVLLFFRLLVVLHRRDIVYISNLLPFGAALAGFIRGANVAYHIHEVNTSPGVLQKFLFNVANTAAARVIFTSRYLAGRYAFTKPAIEIIYDCLPVDFIIETNHIKRLNTARPFTVTMLSPLDDHKAIHHFISIARKMPQLDFVMVLDTTQKDVDSLKQLAALPGNCTLYPGRENKVKFYEHTHVFVNLSSPEDSIGTCGMTVLKAMHCSRPVICPMDGGAAELVTDGMEGYAIDATREDWTCIALDRMANDASLYRELSEACYLKSLKFSRNIFGQQLHNVFAEMRSDIMDICGVFL